MEDDGNFVSDAELNDYANEGISNLYDMMVDGAAKIFSVNAPILTVVGDNSYSLPSDFYRLVSIDISIGGRYFPGTPGDIRDLARMASNPPIEEEFRYYLRHDMADGSWELFAFPILTAANLAVVYVPEAPTLVNDTDVVSGPNRWHEHIEVVAALMMRSKENKDTTSLEFKKRDLEKRIMDHIRDIDVGTPAQIRDLAAVYDDRPFLDRLPRP